MKQVTHALIIAKIGKPTVNGFLVTAAAPAAIEAANQIAVVLAKVPALIDEEIGRDIAQYQDMRSQEGGDAIHPLCLHLLRNDAKPLILLGTKGTRRPLRQQRARVRKRHSLGQNRARRWVSIHRIFKEVLFASPVAPIRVLRVRCMMLTRTHQLGTNPYTYCD